MSLEKNKNKNKTTVIVIVCLRKIRKITYSKNSFRFDIVYFLWGVVTNVSYGFQKCGDGKSQASDGDEICSGRNTLPLNANEPKSSPMANTLTAFALPAKMVKIVEF